MPALPKDWNTWPPIAKLLPVRFPNGSITTTIAINCRDCNSPTENPRGHISQFPQNVVTVTTVSFCENCEHLIVNKFRIRENGTDWQIEQEGSDGTEIFKARKDPWWKRLIHKWRNTK